MKNYLLFIIIILQLMSAIGQSIDTNKKVIIEKIIQTENLRTYVIIKKYHDCSYKGFYNPMHSRYFVCNDTNFHYKTYTNNEMVPAFLNYQVAYLETGYSDFLYNIILPECVEFGYDSVLMKSYSLDIENEEKFAIPKFKIFKDSTITINRYCHSRSFATDRFLVVLIDYDLYLQGQPHRDYSNSYIHDDWLSDSTNSNKTIQYHLNNQKKIIKLIIPLIPL